MSGSGIYAAAGGLVSYAPTSPSWPEETPMSNWNQTVVPMLSYRDDERFVAAGHLTRLASLFQSGAMPTP